MDSTRTFSSFSVDDVDRAEGFYSDTLGLDVTKDENGLLTLQLGGGSVMVYPKDDHSPARYTVLNFMVDDVEGTVDELSGKGVSFERYPEFEQDEKGISHQRPMPDIAWFTDPAGNIMSLVGARP